MEQGKLATVYYGLTATETEAAVGALRERDATVLVEVAGIPVSTLRGQKPAPPRYFHLLTEANNLDRLTPHLNAVFDKIRPLDACVRHEELKITSLLVNMFERGDFQWSHEADSPMYQLCLQWEFVTVGVFFRRFIV